MTWSLASILLLGLYLMPVDSQVESEVNCYGNNNILLQRQRFRSFSHLSNVYLAYY